MDTAEMVMVIRKCLELTANENTTHGNSNASIFKRGKSATLVTWECTWGSRKENSKLNSKDVWEKTKGSPEIGATGRAREQGAVSRARTALHGERWPRVAWQAHIGQSQLKPSANTCSVVLKNVTGMRGKEVLRTSPGSGDVTGMPPKWNATSGSEPQLALETRDTTGTWAWGRRKRLCWCKFPEFANCVSYVGKHPFPKMHAEVLRCREERSERPGLKWLQMLPRCKENDKCGEAWKISEPESQATWLLCTTLALFCKSELTSRSKVNLFQLWTHFKIKVLNFKSEDNTKSLALWKK